MAGVIKYRLAIIAVAVLVCAVIGLQVDATVGKKARSKSVKGIVTDSQGRPVVDAMVYLIDSSTINLTPISQPDIIAGISEGYDEPLEDIVNNSEKAKLLPQGKTDKSGKYSIKKANADATYFVFVKPADSTYLPGGDKSRNALSLGAFPKGGLNIKLSWNFPAGATYIGSTACLVCHTEVNGWKKHAHALMFTKPSGPTANQDASFHTAWFDVAAKFKSAATHTGGTVLHFQDFDSTNSNRYIIYEGTAKTGSTTELRVYLWKDSTSGAYKVTFENVRNPADPNSPKTYEVGSLMGGYLRQRVLLKIPGRKNQYPTFGYQAFTGSASQGLMTNYDRSRKPWQEGGPGGGGTIAVATATSPNPTPLFFKRAPTAAETLLTEPLLTTHNAAPACVTCHFTAYSEYTDAGTGETLAHGVADPNGVADWDSDGATDETSIGCEVCHGPGSKHREEALIASSPTETTTTRSPRTKTVVDNHRGKFIINPNFLGNDRGSLLCGRCHAGPIFGEGVHALPPPGISRAEMLATYASPTGKGTPAFVRNSPKFWPDNEHERGGHEGVSYANWIESHHARNTRQLLACYDCHDLHGSMQFRYGLRGDPDDSQGGLCNQCHTQDIVEHVLEMTGSPMSGAMMKCNQCHMPRTGKGGAGRPGLLIGTPASNSTNSVAADANLVYWENDQSSHLWEVPTKFTPGVAGVQPGLAMPVPYTNSCAPCHDASKLQYQGPSH